MTSSKRSKKAVKAISQAVDDVDPLASLKMKLKTTEPEIQNYATALKNENLKLQRQIAKLQGRDRGQTLIVD